MATRPYKFVTPIRYYKANDPYYYEVDNIPLRQLEENILFVKRFQGFFPIIKPYGFVINVSTCSWFFGCYYGYNLFQVMFFLLYFF